MSFSDKEYYQLTISISKALMGMEMPLKTKHARAAIIGTFHTQGAHSFWAVTLRQPLQENRITAWKFCHLLHKVLREGHPLCCQQSMRHRAMLSELGKLWGHLNDGYGLCIRHYTKLLITKLEFHDRNPRIPGSLALKRGELENIAGNDINFYFQMAVEMFDYLDDIIALQATIFNSITTFHVNSMTSAGQCRLSPLIPLIQDSNQLYDFSVRIMFKLHGNLPNDVLKGHRDRFRTIFSQLKSFYSQSRNLQYFVSLITVPKLPEKAPNFLSQVDFGSYTAPVVVVPEPEPVEQSPPEQIVDNLVDTSMQQPVVEEVVQQQHIQSAQQAPPEINFEQIIQERDGLIRHLQLEVERLGKYLSSYTKDQREVTAKYEEQIAALNSQMSDAQEDLMNMRFVKEELELKVQNVEKNLVEEEKIKASEEKFVKLKLLYTQIRDEHIKLLRQHGEVNKILSTSSKTATNATKEIEMLRTQLEEVQQQNSETFDQEKNTLTSRINSLEAENTILSAKFADLNANSMAEKAELQIKLDNLEKVVESGEKECAKIKEEKQEISNKHQQLVEQKVEIEQKLHETAATLQQIQIKSDENSKQTIALQQNVADTEKSKAEYARCVEELQQKQHELNVKCMELNERNESIENEKQELNQQLAKLTESKLVLVQEKEEANIEMDILKRNLSEQINECKRQEEEFRQQFELKLSECVELTRKLEANEQKYQHLQTDTIRALSEKDKFESDLQDLLNEQEELGAKYAHSQDTIRALEQTIEDTKIRSESSVQALLATCIKTSEKLILNAISDTDVASVSGTPGYFMLLNEELQGILDELTIVYANYTADARNVEGFARKIILAGHLMATVHDEGMIICGTSSDIEFGERISVEIQKWNKNITELFSSLQESTGLTNQPELVNRHISNVKAKLQDISSMIHELSKNADGTGIIADIIESELAGMDKAIEEAATRIEDMLSKSRQSDKGIQLEVNEKILDTCTSLMNAIRILIKKSRLLQEEIVSLGKGTATAKEYYKRNHQWTEGLISAAKSVASGANLLVIAANKAVSGESGHHFELIVAAQEIAACTAQLVVSSRVKAPSGSTKLAALSTASRDVSQATGTVVATVKDCNRLIDDSQDLDFENLTPYETKRREIEIQVEISKLEKALESEQSRLAELRRNTYRNG